MDIKTYRAKTMRDALELVRRELGPSAAVLHTREMNSGPLSRLVFGRKYEVAASAGGNVPSRVPEGMQEVAGVGCQVSESGYGIDGEGECGTSMFGVAADANCTEDYRSRYRDDF